MAAILTPERSTNIIKIGRADLRLVEAGPGSTSVTHREDVPWVAIVAGCLFLFLVLSAFTIVSGRGGLADASPSPRHVSAAEVVGQPTVTVTAGDTMWSIARSIQPTGDVRPLVDELIALNGSAAIRPGQTVVLPA